MYFLRDLAFILRRLVTNIALALPPVFELTRRRNAKHLGAMYDYNEVVGLLCGHLERLREAKGQLNNLRALELGPGNSLGMALMFAILGAERVTALDVRFYAQAETSGDVYQNLVDNIENWIKEKRLEIPLSAEERGARITELLPAGTNFPRLGDRLHYQIYDGLAIPLPDNSINFFYSVAVLEHVNDPEMTYREIARVMEPNGVCSLIIDLADHHHQDPFNFLRYSDRLWQLMSSRSFGATNRLRGAEHLRLLEIAGFDLLSVTRKQEPVGSIPRNLAPRFRDYTEDELRTTALIVTARMSAKP